MWYLLAFAVTLGSIFGLIRLLLTFKLEAWQKAFGFCCLLIVLISFVALHITKTWAWFFTGAQDFATGRFLLIGVIALACLLLGGLRGWGTPHSRIGTGLWLWSSSLFLFNLAAIFANLAAFYY
jgi:hypothetical protein